jgi:hypothetical protein
VTEVQWREMEARREMNLRRRGLRRIGQLPEKQPRGGAAPGKWELVAWFRALPHKHKLALRRAYLAGQRVQQEGAAKAAQG